MAAETQAQCLHTLERINSMGTAARASILGAFTAGQGYCADADYSVRAWLIHKTKVTKGAAVAYTAWARRAVAHPQVAEVLAAGQMSESFGRMILPGHAEYLAAGDENPNIGAGPQQRAGQDGARVQQMLAVVQHQQSLPVRQAVSQRDRPVSVTSRAAASAARTRPSSSRRPTNPLNSARILPRGPSEPSRMGKR